MQLVRLDTTGFVFVGSNGSRSADAATGEILTSHLLPPAIVHRIIGLCAQRGAIPMLCDGDDLVVDRPDSSQVRFETGGNALRLRAVLGNDKSTTAGQLPQEPQTWLRWVDRHAAHGLITGAVRRR